LSRKTLGLAVLGLIDQFLVTNKGQKRPASCFEKCPNCHQERQRKNQFVNQSFMLVVHVDVAIDLIFDLTHLLVKTNPVFRIRNFLTRNKPFRATYLMTLYQACLTSLFCFEPRRHSTSSLISRFLKSLRSVFALLFF